MKILFNMWIPTFTFAGQRGDCPQQYLEIEGCSTIAYIGNMLEQSVVTDNFRPCTLERMRDLVLYVIPITGKVVLILGRIIKV
jgi:hypothetical protein